MAADTEVGFCYVKPLPSLNCILCPALSFILLQLDIFWSKASSWHGNTETQGLSRTQLSHISMTVHFFASKPVLLKES